jgi:hypothetical protein
MSFGLIETGRRRPERPRFVERRAGRVETSFTDREVRAHQQTFDAPSPHAHFEALPLAGGGVGRHAYGPGANTGPPKEFGNLEIWKCGNLEMWLRFSHFQIPTFPDCYFSSSPSFS